jgi:hypothetical protein
VVVTAAAAAVTVCGFGHSLYLRADGTSHLLPQTSREQTPGSQRFEAKVTSDFGAIGSGWFSQFG